MSYRRSWSKTFDPAEFTVEVPFGHDPPTVCTTHEYCFRAERAGLPGLSIIGTWRMSTPIDVKAVMPGTGQKILEAYCAGMRRGWQGWGGLFAAEVRLIADGAKIFSRIVDFAQDEWRDNWARELNKDISGVTNLDMNLYQECSRDFPSTYLDMHVALIKIDCEYYSVTAPETATVKLTVTNTKTGVLVKGAYVALMSGARVVADGYTDGGEVKFEGIDEGSYTVKVLAGGYYDFEQSIKVEPPSVWYAIKIVPIPVTPIPDWVKYAVLGIGVLGAITIIPAVIRRKPEERVVVVK